LLLDFLTFLFFCFSGSLTGNVDIFALNQLILDGTTKNISSVAALINRGHCEWGNGDIITTNNGNFKNFGTIQVKGNVNAGAFSGNMMYIGADVPLENGGDPFALSYHSWDMDEGSLDFSQYISKRTQFVSQVPENWTSADQHQTNIFNN
jgi:hypothetical protein